MTNLLKKEKFNVLEAQEGNKALDLLKKHRTDLVLTDLEMEGMSGIELTKEVHQFYPNLEVVVYSSHGTEASHKKLERLGVFGFLEKPVTHEKIVTLIAEGSVSSRIHRLGIGNSLPQMQFNHGRALLVDDHHDTAEELEQWLQDLRFKTSRCEKTKKAQGQVVVNDFDIVVINSGLKGLDIDDFIENIRNHDRYTAIVIVNYDPKTDLKERWEAKGANKVLEGPPQKASLDSAIDGINFDDIRDMRHREQELIHGHAEAHRHTMEKFGDRNPFLDRWFKRFALMAGTAVAVLGLTFGGLFLLTRNDGKDKGMSLMEKVDLLLKGQQQEGTQQQGRR